MKAAVQNASSALTAAATELACRANVRTLVQELAVKMLSARLSTTNLHAHASLATQGIHSDTVIQLHLNLWCKSRGTLVNLPLVVQTVNAEK